MFFFSPFLFRKTKPSVFRPIFLCCLSTDFSPVFPLIHARRRMRGSPFKRFWRRVFSAVCGDFHSKMTKCETRRKIRTWRRNLRRCPHPPFAVAIKIYVLLPQFLPFVHLIFFVFFPNNKKPTDLDANRWLNRMFIAAKRKKGFGIRRARINLLKL